MFASLGGLQPLPGGRLLSPCNARTMSRNTADPSTVSLDPASFASLSY